MLPALPLLVVLLGYLPQKGQTATVLVLSLLGWPWGARVIRAQTLALRNRDFVAAARETGERSWHIIVFEIMPNEVSLIAANFVNTVLYAIGASVALAFIGLADLNTWSLGTMLYWAWSAQALDARRLVVVRAPGAGGRPDRHGPGLDELRDRRARQPPPTQRQRLDQGRRPVVGPDRPDAGARARRSGAPAEWRAFCTRSRVKTLTEGPTEVAGRLR